MVLIAGPTASGKSALALALACRLDGVVINADSMQVYRELPVLTAQPGPLARATVPHRLYGVLSALDECSVGRWLELAQAEIHAALRVGKTPVVIGGSGLYLRALCEGIAPVPRVPVAVRQAVADRLLAHGLPALFAELRARDPRMAARLRPSDPQRIARALEVLDATGESLADWQRVGHRPPEFGVPLVAGILQWPRAELYRRCDARFVEMLAAGALGEADGYRAQGVPEGRPLSRALGLRPLLRHLEGALPLEAAIAAAQQETRRYAKRQLTWFRNKMMSWNPIEAQECNNFIANPLSFLTQYRLTPANRGTKLPAR